VYALDITASNKTKEQLIEEILLKRYISDFSKITGNKLYQCPRITQIQEVNNKYLIKATLVTFKGPHNPPYEGYIITFYEEPTIENGEIVFRFTIENVERIQNLSGEQLRDFCK
jgi:hypothetical protein